MITAITLNAAIDQIYEVNALEVGGVNRISSIMKDAGGKGMNVAKVLQSSGAAIDVGGFAGGANGDKIRQLLDARSLSHEMIDIAEENRVCLTVLDGSDGQGTELLESGPVITAAEWSAMLEWLDRKSREVKWFALSGSLPKGVPADAYKQMITIINANGAKAVLDTSGDALKTGLDAKPFAIKPNEEEIAAITGKEVLTEADLLEAGEQLVTSGIEHVCFSLGGDGAIFVNGSGAYSINAPEVDVVNTVGSGDSFVGGFLYGCATGEDFETAYKRAIACGTCNAMHKEIGYVEMDTVEALMKEISVTQLK